jgi:hypothetical protein
MPSIRKPDTKVSIYVLLDEHGEVFYVGQSERPDDRLYPHKRRFGKTTSLRVIQSDLNSEDAYEAESWWVRYYTQQGCKLENIVLLPNARSVEDDQNFEGLQRRKFRTRLRRRCQKMADSRYYLLLTHGLWPFVSVELLSPVFIGEWCAIENAVVLSAFDSYSEADSLRIKIEKTAGDMNPELSVIRQLLKEDVALEQGEAA